MIVLPLAPAAITDDVVQVTVWPAIKQVQPVPVAAVGVRPAGIVSVIVMTPLVEIVPTLLGVSVKYPVVLPAPKLAGVWVFAMARSEAAPGCSPKLLFAEIELLPTRLILVIRLLVPVGLVAVPPVLPAVVVPFVVPAGWFGWFTVYVPSDRKSTRLNSSHSLL
jgi:hypothetical protein